MRAFISSVIAGFEEFREAASSGASVLRHEVVRAEDFPASAESPYRACLQGVEDSDVVLLILGERYGHRQEFGKSAPHEEFAHAVSLGRPVLAFTMEGVTRDSDMAAFVREVEAWAGGQMAGRFSTAEELRDAVTFALSRHALAEQAGPVDADALMAKAASLVPTERGFGDTTVAVAVAAGPVQAIIRPAAMEDPALCETIKQQAMFGPARVIDSDRGARCQLRGDDLLVNNDLEQILLTPAGDHMIAGPARPRTRGSGLNPVIIEEAQERIWRALRFGGWLLDHIDPTGRVRQVAPTVSVVGSLVGWSTRAEYEARPNQMSAGLGTGGTPAPVWLTPPVRPRPALLAKASEMAEDFAVFLDRQARH